MSAERSRRASRLDDAGKRHHDREATASRSRRAVPPVKIEAKVEVEVENENDPRFDEIPVAMAAEVHHSAHRQDDS